MVDAETPVHRPRVRTAIARGARKRCPHCGRGPLFVRWITTHPHCSACGFVYIRNYGDTWLFWILMDRIPIFLGIVSIYFGFRVSDWVTGTLFFAAMAVPLIATMPRRQGVAIALSYLSRVYLPDPSDPIPAVPHS